MAVSFKPLWKTLIDKDKSKIDLVKDIPLSPNIVANMAKNQFVSLKTVDSICQYLNCSIEEVVEIVHENDRS